MSSNGERLKERLRSVFDAGASFAKLSRSDLERMARDLLEREHLDRDRIEDGLEELRARAMRDGEQLIERLRSVRPDLEAAAQLYRSSLADGVDRLAGLLGELFGGVQRPESKASTAAGRSGEQEAASQTSAPARAKSTVAKKAAPAKKTAAKTAQKAARPKAGAPTKKTAGTKASVSKEAPAKRAAGTKKQGSPKKTSSSPRAAAPGASKAT